MAIPEEVAEALAGLNDKAVFDAWWNAAPRDVLNDTTESGESLLALAASLGNQQWQLDIVKFCLAQGGPQSPGGTRARGPGPKLARRLSGDNLRMRLQAIWA